MLENKFAQEVAQCIKDICEAIDNSNLPEGQSIAVKNQLTDLAMMTARIKKAEADKELEGLQDIAEPTNSNTNQDRINALEQLLIKVTETLRSQNSKGTFLDTSAHYSMDDENDTGDLVSGYILLDKKQVNKCIELLNKFEPVGYAISNTIKLETEEEGSSEITVSIYKKHLGLSCSEIPLLEHKDFKNFTGFTGINFERLLQLEENSKSDCLWKPKYLPTGETYDEYYQYSGTVTYPKDADFPSWYESALFLAANCSGVGNFIICLDKDETTKHRRSITKLEFRSSDVILNTYGCFKQAGLNKVNNLSLNITFSDKEVRSIPIDFAAWLPDGNYIGEEHCLSNVVVAYTDEIYLDLKSLKNSLASAFYDEEEDEWLVSDEELSQLIKVPHPNPNQDRIDTLKELFAAVKSNLSEKHQEDVTYFLDDNNKGGSEVLGYFYPGKEKLIGNCCKQLHKLTPRGYKINTTIGSGLDEDGDDAEIAIIVSIHTKNKYG